jgi:hypothetical protein
MADSPLSSSTRGMTMDEHNRGRTEFEARIERAVGSRIKYFRFNADFENRSGDLECLSGYGRTLSEATEHAKASCNGTALTFLYIHTEWRVAFFEDGQIMHRHDLERLLDGARP